MALIADPNTPTDSHAIRMAGCKPTPLASYLKALAILRIVSETSSDQGGDPNALGFWRDDTFVLRTRLASDEILTFFRERYRPTPLVAPWGARSGFYSGSSEKAAREALTTIAESNIDRLSPFRDVISSVSKLLLSRGFDEKASDDKKLELLSLCRATLPDIIVPWLDACYVLTSNGRQFPPLLGTGGNEGSGSYVSGFAQQVVACIAERKHDHALAASLFGTREHNVSSNQTPGHFYPGAGGGPNSSSGFDGPIQLNPWDYLFALEGAILFAASATRRLESGDPAILAAPFTVRSRAGTAGPANAIDDADRRGEIWMPIWSNPAGLNELRCLLAEGRAAVNGRAARDGIDFARAVAQLGVDRGIDSFQRYAFLKRAGKAFIATPLGRIPVRRNVDADLISDLERGNWLASVQRYAQDENALSGFRSAARQLDTALFALTQRSTRATLQNVLRQIGRIEFALSRSAECREEVRAPIGTLKKEWAVKAGGEHSMDSAEFRIAMALGGLRMPKGKTDRILDARSHIVRISDHSTSSGFRAWDPQSSLAVWETGPLTRNVASLLNRRRLEAIKINSEGEVLASVTGATIEDIDNFLAAQTDDRRISELLAGLACVALTGIDAPRGMGGNTLPPGFAILKIFFSSNRLLRSLNFSWLPEDGDVHLPAEIPNRLMANDVQTALRLAWQRLRSLNVKLPGRHPPRVIGADGPRWLAALCIPLTMTETRRLFDSLNFESKQHPTTEFAR